MMTGRTVFGTFVVMCMAVVLARVGLADSKSTQRASSDVHFVRLAADALAEAQALNLGTPRTLDYGAFAWVELSAADFSALQASDLPFEVRVDAFKLRLGELSFDPLVGPPQLPPGWDTVKADGPDLHIIQFVGPPRIEWLDTMTMQGLETVQYIYPHSYIVWGQSADIADPHDAIRWIGPFAPAYRVLPQWRNLPDEHQEVNVLLYRGANSDEVVAMLEELGGEITERTVLNDTFEVVAMSMSGATFQAAAQVAGVYSIQVRPTDGGLRGEMSDQVNVNNVDGSNQAFPGYLNWIAEVGLDGTGVIIANVDGGIQDSHPDLASRLIPCTGQTCGGGASSSHGTHTAGIMAADGSSGTLDPYGFLRGLGVAPGANLVEQTYSGWYQQPGGMLLLMTDSYNNDASLSGNSWGPSGSPQGYDNHTMQVDIGVRDADPGAPGNQPLTFVLSFMNGNGGTSSQGTPDEAKNLFNIGSTKMQTSGGAQILQIDDLSSNTAHGPALDGRTIPHMVAPGCYVDSSTSGSGYTTMCGTSMASPHVSGAVALFIDYYRGLPEYISDPSPAMIKAAFLPVARDLAGHNDADGGTLGHPFDSKQGWGRMDIPAVVDPQVAVRYFDNPATFDNAGEEWAMSFSPFDPAEPMRFMLVWTDAYGHGLGGSTPAWNNDLDLVVEAGSDTYRGNDFGSDGWSQPSITADYMNNTEGVFLGPTPPPVATVRVFASDINSDGIPNEGDATDQDFALVCYNCALEPGFLLSVDPPDVTVCAPEYAVYEIEVAQIMDYDDPVTLSSTGAPVGTFVTFSENPVIPPGNSTMTIEHTQAAEPGSHDVTVIGTAPTQTREIDVGFTVYSDVPSAVSLVAPPNGATEVSLRPSFEWTTSNQAAEYEFELAADENFTDIVESASGLTETTYTVQSQLEPESAYFWRARAFNVCGVGNDSAIFSFTTRATLPVLLVDDDDNSPNVQSYYTDALAALGQEYDVWDTNNSDNEPDAATLSQYAVVIWFSGDEWGGDCGPGGAGESALGAFLDSGGCLFISSQDYHYDRSLTPFMNDYLGVSSATNDITQTSVTGEGSVFGDMGPYSLSYPFTNYSDRITPDADAELAFAGNLQDAAVNKDNDVYRTTFWGFPWEAIDGADNRIDLLNTVLDWCASSPFEDCNGNGIPDEDDIDSGESSDVNNNGIPDDCEGPIGDIDGDGDVDAADLAELLGGWGPCSPLPECPGDLNGDGTVDATDLALLLGNWG